MTTLYGSRSLALSAWVSLSLLVLTACGGGGGSGTEGGEGGSDSGDAGALDDIGADGGDTTGGGDGSILDGSEDAGEAGDDASGGTELPDTEPFWVLYGLTGRIQGQNLGITDLFLMDRDGNNPLDPSQGDPLSMTGFSLTGQQFQWCQQSPLEQIGCANGCFVDEGLKWLAVQLPLPSPEQVNPDSEEYDPSFDCLAEMTDSPDVTKGISIQLGQFDQFLKAKLIKDAIITNIIHLAFAGDYFYYSKLAQCVGSACQYDIYRADLSKAFKAEKILTFPPDNHLNLNLWNSQYKGHFHVSDDGEFLALQNPFFGAQQQWVWTGGNTQLLQQNCDDGDVQCVSTGTGAEHTDRDPVAVAPDYQDIVTITKQGSRLRAWRYSVYGEEEGQWTVLMSVPEGSSYKTQACNHLLEDWQFVDVPQVQYAPEGDSLIYLGRSECGQVNTKPRTDLMELDTSVLCSCTTVTSEDIRNITNNPDNSTADNIVYSAFDMCPGGDVLAAVGTPRFDQSGKVIPDSSTAHRNDRELYLMSRDGKVLKQMTRDLEWEVSSVRCIKPKTFGVPGQ